MPTPPAGALTSTFQIGTYNALTDTFTLVLDLNDFATFWIEWNSFKIPQPKKVYVRSSNIRVPGEAIQRFQYQNRHIQCSLRLKNTSTQSILNSIRALLSAVENPPYVLRIAQPGAKLYSYADVLAVQHNIPADPQALLAGVIPSIQMDFECKPGLRGDRVHLQNLAFNPGFETPGGAQTLAFTDSFTNGDAYTAGSVAASTLTLTSGTFAQFGSPNWGPINLWLVRWQFATGLTGAFYLHWVDSNNQLFVQISSTTISLINKVAGTNHTLASATIGALTNANWYWLKFTEFPGPYNYQLAVQASLYNDSAGTVGTLVASSTLGPTHSFDGITALAGRMALFASGATMNVGGVSGGNNVFLFGPGGWTIQNFGTAPASGAWEAPQAIGGSNVLTNGYQGGPTFSNGTARIDLPPTGAVNAAWYSWTGGTPAGTTAIPISAPFDTLGVSCAVMGSGLGASAIVSLVVNEYGNTGTFLRSGAVMTMSSTSLGTNTWKFLSGGYTTGASCVYASLALFVTDATSGSANGTVWFDNVLCWDATSTGMASMPYNETRAVQSPMQMMVSGLLGDMPAPAVVELGAYFSNFALGQSGVCYIGRRANASPSIRMVTASTAPISCNVDPNSWGGFNALANLGPYILSVQAENGIFHVLGRASTGNGAPTNNVFIASQVFLYQVGSGQTWVIADPQMGFWQGPNSYPFTASNVWTTCDAGQLILPPFPTSNLADPTQEVQYISTTSGGSGGSQLTVNWLALLPVDGDLFVGALTNSPGVTTQWVYLYWDGTAPGATTYSYEVGPLPNPNHSISNTGSSNLAVSPVGDSIVYVDPTTDTGAASTAEIGVNQFLAHLSDNAGTVLPLACDIVYSPLYLYPR